MKEIEVAPPFWLKHYGRLGSKSGLMYTLAKLEKRVMEPWEKTAQNENDASSADTRQIMDNVFSNELLPILFQMHHQGYMKMLPGIEADKYSTSTSVLREFNKLMANRGNNVDFSAAFAAHALISGIFVLQSDDHCKRLAVLSKLVTAKFESQIRGMMDSSYTAFLHENFRHGAVKEVTLLHDILSSFQKSHAQTFWNPLLAGTYMLTVTFESNMARGFCYMDALMQTRIVLHLYIGLRQRGLIDTIDLLELLDRVLYSNKRVWPLGKPGSSSLLKSFAVAVGDSSRVADSYADFLGINDTDEDRMREPLASRFACIVAATRSMSSTRTASVVSLRVHSVVPTPSTVSFHTCVERSLTVTIF